MKKIWGKKTALLVATLVFMLLLLGTGAETVKAEFVEGEEITTQTLILKVGEVWEIRNSNIDPLISEEAVAANASISRVYPTGGSWDDSITEEEYLTGNYRIKISNKATREVIDIKYYTEEERLVRIHEFIDGKFDEIYGMEVGWTESGSPFYMCAEKAGETFVSIPKYHIGTETDYVEVDLLIPVIIEENSATGPEPGDEFIPESKPGDEGITTGLSVEPMPTMTEHILENGQKVRMIIEKGNPYEYIIGDVNVIEPDWNFYCKEITVGQGYDIAKNAVDTQIGKDYKFTLFDMGITGADSTPVHKLSDNINVTILLDNSFEFKDEKTAIVYGLNMDTGDLTRCDTVMDDRFMTFATYHFSYYIAVEQGVDEGPALVRDTISTAATSPKTGEVTMLPVVMLAMLSMGVAVLTTKKRMVK